MAPSRQNSTNAGIRIYQFPLEIDVKIKIALNRIEWKSKTHVANPS